MTIPNILKGPIIFNYGTFWHCYIALNYNVFSLSFPTLNNFYLKTLTQSSRGISGARHDGQGFLHVAGTLQELSTAEVRHSKEGSKKEKNESVQISTQGSRSRGVDKFFFAFLNEFYSHYSFIKCGLSPVFFNPAPPNLDPFFFYFDPFPKCTANRSRLPGGGHHLS